MSRSDDLLEAAQKDAQQHDDFSPGDMVVDVIMVCVYRNFESGDEGVMLSTSAPDTGHGFPTYKALGMLTEALELVGNDD